MYPFVFPLAHNCSYSEIARIAHDFERKILVRCLYEGGGYQGFLYFPKRLYGLWCEVEFNFFTDEGGERSSDFAEILYEPPLKSGMSEKTSHIFYVCGFRQAGHYLNLCPI